LHAVFCDLLFVWLSADTACDGSHEDRKPVMGLAGGNGFGEQNHFGDQDEKRSEGSHDPSPCLDGLKSPREKA
jgi:hypothetical protein